MEDDEIVKELKKFLLEQKEEREVETEETRQIRIALAKIQKDHSNKNVN